MTLEYEQISLKIRAADPALIEQAILSSSEQVRLASMHEGARPSFVTARAMLRRALGTCMGLDGSAVSLAQQGAGRVSLIGLKDDEPPFFSVSHSGSAEAGIAAVAVSMTTPIGIDIQQIDYHIDWKRIAERRFPAQEWDLMRAMPDNEGRMLFFTLWAIKEACVKMENGTLMPYLRGIEIEFNGGEFQLVSPTPGGSPDISIFFHFLPELDLAVACVSQRKTRVALDCDVEMDVVELSTVGNAATD